MSWQDEARALVACGWFEWRHDMSAAVTNDAKGCTDVCSNGRKGAFPLLTHAPTQGVLLSMLANKVGGYAVATGNVIAEVWAEGAGGVRSEQWGIALSRALRAAHESS